VNDPAGLRRAGYGSRFKQVLAAKCPAVQALLLGRGVALAAIFIFVFLNWLLSVGIEKLAHPDFYVYQAASEKLFSGDFKLGIIPPLFPFLLGLAGKCLGLLGGSTDSFILAGRIISLVAGLGVVWFTHKLLQRFAGPAAITGTLILVCSPFFLKLLAIPQTDMLYLFFFSAAAYFFLPGGAVPNVAWSLAGGLLTRFEGILLLGSACLNYFNLRKRRLLYFGLSVIPLAAALYFLFLEFAPRLIARIGYVVSGRHYLFYFQHPQELGRLLYGNFFQFVPPGFPGLLKWTLLAILLLLFFIGLHHLFLTNRRFALALVFYQAIFIIFKGYAATLDPNVEFRRMLSVIWIFLVVAFIGAYVAVKKIGRVKKLSLPGRLVLYGFLVAMALFMPVIKGKALVLFLFLLPGIIYGVRRSGLTKPETVALFLVLALFLGQFYFDAGKRAHSYVKNNTNKAGFVIAAWLNQQTFADEVLVYSYMPMVRYYLERPVKTKEFLFKDETIFRDRERLIRVLLEKAKKQRIRHIVFDEFLNPEEGHFKVAIQNMLYEEKEKLHRRQIKEEDSFFSLVKTLLYRGKPVAWVLKPRYEKLAGHDR